MTDHIPMYYIEGPNKKISSNKKKRVLRNFFLFSVFFLWIVSMAIPHFYYRNKIRKIKYNDSIQIASCNQINSRNAATIDSINNFIKNNYWNKNINY